MLNFELLLKHVRPTCANIVNINFGFADIGSSQEIEMFSFRIELFFKQLNSFLIISEKRRHLKIRKIEVGTQDHVGMTKLRKFQNNLSS